MKTIMNDRRSLIGGILIIIAIFLVLDSFDLIPYFLPGYLFSFSSLLILIGLFVLGNRQNKTPGVILIAIGTYNLLPDIFGIESWQIRRLFWPLILLAIGISFILRRRVYNMPSGSFSSTNPLTLDYIDEFGIFGGGERIVSSQQFQGGRLTSIFGGLKINLLNAGLADGHQIIDVFTVFGGTELLVPAGWNVKVEVFSLFGGFNDKRRIITSASLDEQRVLYIKGIVLFGGGELKSV